MRVQGNRGISLSSPLRCIKYSCLENIFYQNIINKFTFWVRVLCFFFLLGFILFSDICALVFITISFPFFILVTETF